MAQTATKQKNSTPTAIRPPIVVILGHIDHGKTKLLDAILKTNIIDTEAGGITQHIGAYEIVHNGKKITFIDTPGHEAFSSLRSRGAKAADIGVLVVAGDEGVKPQTKEAINVLQQTKTPFVVALNKMDKPEANPGRVKQQLAEVGVQVEGYGGQVPIQEISAKQETGVNELLDLILLVAELEQLAANSDVPASGMVIESHMDMRRGIVATLIITNGFLKRGDFIIAEQAGGKVKILEDFHGRPLANATFSSPVIVIGFESLPPLGAQFRVAGSKKELDMFREQAKSETVEKTAAISQSQDGKKILKVVLKADKQGSLEAFEESLKALKFEEVGIEIIDASIGDITENDIKMITSAGTKVAIFGFHVKIPSAAASLAEQNKVEIVASDIIYELLDNIKEKLKELLEPEVRRTTVGRIKILGAFKASPNFQIVGGKVTDGAVRNGLRCLILRADKEIGQGTITQVQQNKVNVGEAKINQECGLMVNNVTQNAVIAVSDKLECFEEEIIKKELK